MWCVGGNRNLAGSKKSGTGTDHVCVPSLWNCDDRDFRAHKI